MTYNCPMKNLHIGIEHEEEDQQKEKDDDHFDFGFYKLDDFRG